MTLHAGQRLRSVVCETQVIVTRLSDEAIELECGGSPMVDLAVETASGEFAASGEPTLIGKRYVDDAQTIEVLCTKGGQGTLSIAGSPLAVKDAKPLPSSD